MALSLSKGRAPRRAALRAESTRAVLARWGARSGLDQLAGGLQGHGRRIGPLRDRRIGLAVSHVRPVAPFEHLDRFAAVGRVDLHDDALGHLSAAAALGLRKQREGA